MGQVDIILSQLITNWCYIIMRTKKLSERIASLKAASDFEHKLIDSIYSIMSMKKKAQSDYKASLENINRQLEKYVVSDNGFLTEIIRAYQSYIAVVYQNQATLIQGYDNEILSFLMKAKNSKVEEDILKKVQFVDTKVDNCQEQIKHYKKLIRQNQEDIRILESEAAFKSKLKQLGEEEKKKMAENYNDLQNMKKINEQNLEQHVDGMMDLTMLHNQTVEELNQYETTYLEQKASDVYDNFMRAFVLEVSFMRNIQFDMTNILQRVNDKKEENKRIAFDNLRRKMNEQRGIKDSLWGAYKKWTTSEVGVDINEQFITPKIRDKWKRVCEYYNQASI